ncbi:MAG: anti-sigma factor family protein [Armatimonadota bacterium]
MALDCLTTQEWIAAFIDGELDPLQHDELQAHLAACPACRAELACQRETMTLLRQWEAPIVSPQLSVRFAECLQERQAPPPFFTRLLGLNRRRLAWGAVATATFALVGFLSLRLTHSFTVNEQLTEIQLPSRQHHSSGNASAPRPTQDARLSLASMVPVKITTNTKAATRHNPRPALSSPAVSEKTGVTCTDTGVSAKFSVAPAPPDATTTVVALLEETPVPSTTHGTVMYQATTDSRLTLRASIPASFNAGKDSNGTVAFDSTATNETDSPRLSYNSNLSVVHNDGSFTNGRREGKTVETFGWANYKGNEAAAPPQESLEHYVVAALTETY